MIRSWTLQSGSVSIIHIVNKQQGISASILDVSFDSNCAYLKRVSNLYYEICFTLLQRCDNDLEHADSNSVIWHHVSVINRVTSVTRYRWQSTGETLKLPNHIYRSEHSILCVQGFHITVYVSSAIKVYISSTCRYHTLLKMAFHPCINSSRYF